MATFNRCLKTKPEVESFVFNVLDIFEENAFVEATGKILSVEMKLPDFNAHQTLFDDTYRDESFRSERKREELRKQIHDELIRLERPDHEEDIKLGVGGALPKSGVVKKEKIMYYIIGLPASGKSGLTNLISDNAGAIIIDSDIAKRKLPEYDNIDGGASLVNEESSAIVMSHERQNLLSTCIKEGNNIIIPKIGHKISGIVNFAKAMKEEKGYTVYLILVELDRLKATQRAFNRFVKTGRYVPLSLVFDSYANEPILNYYRILKHHSNIFDGYAHINTDVAVGKPHRIIEDNGIGLLNNGLLKDEKGRVNYEIYPLC